MQRPRLQGILCEAVLESGATVRLGTTAEELVQDAVGVTARFSDGTEGRYDLVIAADGVGSRTRSGRGTGTRQMAMPVGSGLSLMSIIARVREPTPSAAMTRS